MNHENHESSSPVFKSIRHYEYREQDFLHLFRKSPSPNNNGLLNSNHPSDTSKTRIDPSKPNGSIIDHSTLFSGVEGEPRRNRNQPCTVDREVNGSFPEGVKVTNTLKEYASLESFLKYKDKRKASFQGQDTVYGRAMESAGTGTGSRLEELLTVDKKTLKSWRESFGTASSSSITGNDRTKISSETPVENPRKRLLMNALKDSLEKDVESEDKSGKGRKMLRWKTERKSDEAVNNTGAANAASATSTPAPNQKRQRLKSKIKKKLKIDISAQQQDESVEDSSVNQLEISHKDVNNEGKPSLKKNDFEREHMQAQIDKLLKMPSPPSKTWKRSSSSRQAKFQCKLCPKLFSVELELTGHMLTHSNKSEGDAEVKEKEPFEKKYACEFCEGKKFTWLTTLRAHYMNWHGELTQTEKKRLVDKAAARSMDQPFPSYEEEFGPDRMDVDVVNPEKTSSPVSSKSPGTNKVRKVSKKSTPESTKTSRTSRQRNISEDIIKKVSKSISKEIGTPISNKSKKKAVQKIVVEASQSLNSGRASLRRNIQRPKWLTDADLVTDYEFPRGTNTSRSGSATSSPSTSQTTPSSSVVGAQTRASQATAKIPKPKKALEKLDKKKSRASVVRNRVRTKSVDQVKVSSDSQATEQSPAITKDTTTATCATIDVVEAVEKVENGNVDVKDNPPDTPVPPNNDKAKVTDEEVDTSISCDEITQASEVPLLTREISNEIIESPKSCKQLEVEELTTQPVVDNFSGKTTDDEVFNGSPHSAPPQAPVLSKEMVFSNEPLELPETMQVQDSEETQAPPVIDVFNSKSADDEISSSSNQSTALEAPVLSRETINGIPEVVVVPESIKVDDIDEEFMSVEDIKIADDKSSVNGDQSVSSPLSATRKDSTVSSEIAEPPESSEPQVQDLEELPLEDDVIGPKRRDRSDSLSMRSCGSGSQSEKIKGLEDNKEEEEEECSTSKASDKDWAEESDSDSNDSLMSEFSELAAQVSEKTDGVQFKEDCMRFLATKISANSMWAIRKELKRLKKEKNYFKFGKLSPLAACLMHDLFCQSLK